VPEEGGEPREYSLSRGVHVNVQEGDRVRKALHSWLVNEIQEVYRLQGVNINDKHDIVPLPTL
jgi:DNA-directed RNA polymerase subunit beta'